MKTIFTFLIIINIHICSNLSSYDLPIDLDLAKSYFNEARNLSLLDSLSWGKELYGPLFFVDKDTNFMVANQQDKNGFLNHQDGVFIGYYDSVIANTAVKWHGEKWTMVMWKSLDHTNSLRRNSLIMHELWHRIQDEIGLPAICMGGNPHMEHLNARVYMIMEWNALIRALEDETREKEHINNAAIFRNYRRSLFPDAAKNENRFELHEGLAEYTGFKTSMASKLSYEDQKKYLIKFLNQAKTSDNFVNNFAYKNGPVYGFFLDKYYPGWKENLNISDDLGKLLVSKIVLEDKQNIKANVMALATNYNYDEIYNNEKALSEVKSKRLQQLSAKFQKENIFILNGINFNLSLDPRTAVPLDTLGTAYETLHVIDKWGELQSSNDAIVNFNKQYFIVTEPEIIGDHFAKGKDWEITLSDDWKIDYSKEKKIYFLRQIKK